MVLLQVLGAAYVVGLVLWVWAMSRSDGWNSSIHYLMMALLLFKAYTMLAQFQMHFRQLTTGESGGWDVTYYIFAFLTCSLLYLTFFHVAAGGSHMKPVIGLHQKRALMVFLPLQVLFHTSFLWLFDDLSLSTGMCVLRQGVIWLTLQVLYRNWHMWNLTHCNISHIHSEVFFAAVLGI